MILILGAAVFCAGSASAAPNTVTVSINTSSLAGVAGSLDFNFNPGPLVTQAASVQILGFSTDGTLTGTPKFTGDASGTLPATLTFDNAKALNDCFETFTFGTTLLFQVSLFGPALSSPDGVSTSGSTFAFSMFSNAAGNAPALTTDTADGFAFIVNVNLDGTVTVTNFSQQTSAGTPPALTITKTHTGNFTQGEQGTYTVTVSNSAGSVPTSGTVTVTETLPAGLTLVSMSGTGWTCNANICTRSDALAATISYPPIAVAVSAASNAGSPLLNRVDVSGGGSPSASATDSTTVTVPTAPTLSIVKTHAGRFQPGQQGAQYTVTVSNSAGAAATAGTVAVTETLPGGLTLLSMSGTGWTCPAGGTTCTRSDALGGGMSYPPITVTVNVAANASSPQVNQVSASGGGSVSATASDSTIIGPCTFSLSSSGAHLGSGAGAFMNSSATQIFINALTGAFTLTATNCDATNTWTAISSSQPILALHAGVFGAGSAPVYSLSGDGTTASTTIGFAMFANTTGHTRSASITVAGQTFTVTQDASPETSLQRIARALYQTILGREPDSAGFTFWTGPGAPKDSNGVTLINQMADGFYTSTEFSSNGWEVLSIYRAVLGRLPAFSEWLAGASPLRPGTASATLTEALLDSLTGSMTNTAFVTQTVTNAWGRAPTPAEQTQFVAQIAASTSATARLDFLNGTVFANNLFQSASNPLWISALYYTILVRDPDPAGFNFWVQSDTNPPGQHGIYYVIPTSNLPSVYAIKLATIGQAVPPNLNLEGFLGSPEFQSLIQGSSIPVSLSSVYNRVGIYADGSKFTQSSSVDGLGNAFSGNLLSSPQTWDGTSGGATFSLGPANSPDVLSAVLNTIPLPPGRFSSIRMLATGVNGNQMAQTFTVTYSDSTTQTFTQNLSDWLTPMNWPNESLALIMPYRDVSTSARDNRSVYVYGYSFSLNNTKTVSSITLPNDTNLIVLGITAVP